MQSPPYFWPAVSVILVIGQGILLWFMGQVPICECGYVKFWHGITISSENSQHIADWYTFSHIIHGFAFYWLSKLIFPKMHWGARLALAIVAEAGWELFENTDFIINRYREVTISLDYFGDSVINSVFDTLWMVFGFIIAWRFPFMITVALAIAFELWTGFVIRDNLALNVVMLLYPLQAILDWQGGI